MKQLLYVSASLLMFAFSYQSTAQTTLKFNFPKGNVVNYKSLNTMNLTVKGSGMSSDMSSSSNFTFKSLGDSAGLTNVEYTILYNKMSSTGAASININSEEEVADSTSPQGAIALLYKEMCNTPFVIGVNPKGEVVQDKGFKEWIKLHKKQISNMKEAAGGSAKSSFDLNTFKQSFSTLFNILSDKPVKVGSKWKKKNTISTSGINMNFDNTYIIDSLDEHVAVIKIVSDIYAHSVLESMPDVSISILGEAKGKMWLDVATGMVIKQISEAHIESKPEVKAGAGAGMGNEMPVTVIESNSTIEAVK